MVVPKFRVWFGTEMYTEPLIHDGTVYLDCRDFEDDRTFERAILMQFTGLFDKNGIEIFDGDVVKAGEAKDRTFNLKFVSRKFGFHCVHSNGVDYYLGENTEEDYSALFESLEVFEVIGNIYENPELLEEVGDE